MGLPTGNFSSKYAGRLTVTLTSRFVANSYRDGGFPNSGNNGASNLGLRGYAGPSGSPSYTSTIDKYTLTAVLELDYPGGGTSWPIGVQVTGYLLPTSGIYTFGMQDIVLSCKLTKR
jgi:hypothetical protein